ncbi:MAG TPA: 6-carboxytetrahydropterin synthase [Nitrososphaeraceae archaeon]|nr:6-carboxytetrahydropterin synthase [Nitrososphaeraceae archaeon]
MTRNLVENDIKYINHNGVHLSNRTKLSLSNLFIFLGKDHEIDAKIMSPNNKMFIIDFKIEDNKYIQVIDSEEDFDKFNKIKEDLPDLDIIAIGSSKYAGKSTEFESLFLFDSKNCRIGSIFIEDPSLSFDYAHILPLVTKCSILHGHTSTVMVEIIGNMSNGLVMDFSEAKRLIKEAINNLDHKFFINRQYLLKEDEIYYFVQFEGPRGFFNLQLPKSTVYLLEDEATVENLSREIIKILSPKMPKNIDALGVYIYEGVNKGAHLLANLK